MIHHHPQDYEEYQKYLIKLKYTTQEPGLTVLISYNQLEKKRADSIRLSRKLKLIVLRYHHIRLSSLLQGCNFIQGNGKVTLCCRCTLILQKSSNPSLPRICNQPDTTHTFQHLIQSHIDSLQSAIGLYRWKWCDCPS